MSDPWANPDTPTQPGAPYAGPPATAPPPAAVGYPATPYGFPPQPYAGYPPGYPQPWVPVPQGPKRPGQVITAAVLAFVQAGLVLLASVYVVFLASFVGFAADLDGSGEAEGLATEGTVLGFVQVGSAVLLIVGGVMALNSRRRPAHVVLVVSLALQLLLCVYWAVRLTTFGDEIPGGDPTTALLAFVFLFAAGPAVGLGMVLLGAGRAWFTGTARP
ncbi:hypothetical protein ACI8AF_17545 [Blastococcus sp. SYSU D00669]